MTYARQVFTADGATTNFNVTFPYQVVQDLVFIQRNATTGVLETKTLGIDYEQTSYGIFHFFTAPPAGYYIDAIRSTSQDNQRVTFQPGTITADDLNTSSLQFLYLTQEIDDKAEAAYTLALAGSTFSTRAPLLPLDLLEAEALAGQVPVVLSDGTWGWMTPSEGGGGGGGGGGDGPTVDRYPGLDGSAPFAWSGMEINANNCLVEDGFREVWLDWFYLEDADTDMEALLLFASLQIVYGDCVLKFPRKGRGPSGRFIVDALVEFTGTAKLIIDFGAATVRFTNAASCFRYSPGQIFTSSSVQAPSFFVVRGGVMQYSTAVSYLFHWNFKYHPSRDMGTGYAQDMRIGPQDNNNTGQTLVAPFKISNTWFWHCDRIHHKGPPRAYGAIVAGTTLVEQEGLCVVTTIGDSNEVEYVDKLIKPSHSAMVGVEGTFGGGGSYARGKALRQGANIAYFGRNDSGYGYTYSLYEETGTLVAGLCEVLDSAGLVAGSFTITSIGRYYQASEAIYVEGNTSCIACNYAINYTSPANPDASATNKLLNVQFDNMHCAYGEGFIKLNGVAGLTVGPRAYPNAAVASKICFDIDTADNININGPSGTTNGLDGTWFKGRSITAGGMVDCTPYFYSKVWDVDNTVKDFTIAGNRPYTLGATFTSTSTANRYNGTNTRGVRFRNNGAAGVGFDTDDNRKQAWTPTVTGSAANPTTVTVTNASFNLCNGVLTLACKLVFTTVGAADGDIRISLPTLPSGAAFDGMVHGNLNNLPVVGAIDAGNSRIVIANSNYLGTTANGFKVSDVQIPNGSVLYLNASLPVAYS